ncbi:modular serine protease [Drosophila willistoni]|uniref:modular serine protease n=1 Tax=Drosophila willistoni TaxID=7260 RepID=UPI001F07DAE8|nr:modular serine protease [Drosophila willistoni]
MIKKEVKNHYANSSWANEDNNFYCLSGKVIGLDEACNGIDNCNDNSDERYEVCARNNCEDKFRCNYGGCIDIQKRCDGSPDCWDESDENKYECASSDEIAGLYDALKGNCTGEFDFECRIGNTLGCVPMSKVCNGILDCNDGKDEDVEICSAVPCMNEAYRCSTGGCIRSDKVCDHIPDCGDGSDEMDDVCLEKKFWHKPITEEEKKPRPTSPDLTETDPGSETEETEIVVAEKSKWLRSFCKIEDDSGALIAEDYFTSNTYKTGAAVGKNGVVHVRCKSGYQLIGEEFKLCNGTHWNTYWPSCQRVCKLENKLNLQRECKTADELIDCEASPIILKDTEMKVSCASGYESANGHTSANFRCESDGKWKGNSSLPNCIPKCGIFWDANESTFPWVGSLFQRGKYPQFKYMSSVTILSPYVVITNAHVFEESSIPEVNSTEPLLYAIAEGNHTKEFSPQDEHGYVLHNISQIHIASVTIKDAVYKLAILTVVQPFIFGPNLRPICLDFGVAYWNANNPNDWSAVGEIIWEPRNQRYYLTGYVATLDKEFHIKIFKNELIPFINLKEQNV